MIRSVLGFFIICVAFVSSVDAASAPKTKISCREVIARQETQKGIPEGLLKAIATVESGISPWSVNFHGRAHMFKSKEAAAQYIRALVEDGTRNFSVGCMQLHYASHRRHFKSVEAMLEPENNISHAAKLIKKLERRYGSMDKAVKLYHSASPSHHNRYKNRVYGLWAKFKPREQTRAHESAVKPVSLKKSVTPKSHKNTRKIKFGVGGGVQNKGSR